MDTSMSYPKIDQMLLPEDLRNYIAAESEGEHPQAL